MSDSPLVEQARSLWRTLAGVPVMFGSPPNVVTAPGSKLCPPQWTGVVTIGGDAIVTTPSAPVTALVGEAVAGFPAGGVVDEERWRAALAVTDVLGPSTLAYLDATSFRRQTRPLSESDTVRRLPAGHPAVADLLATVPAAEAGESGIAGRFASIHDPPRIRHRGSRGLRAMARRRGAPVCADRTRPPGAQTRPGGRRGGHR